MVVEILNTQISCYIQWSTALRTRLPVLVATEIGRHGVVLNSLVQHQSEQTSSVGHCSPDVTLLLKELIQLVPLWVRKNTGYSWRMGLINVLSYSSSGSPIITPPSLIVGWGPRGTINKNFLFLVWAFLWRFQLKTCRLSNKYQKFCPLKRKQQSWCSTYHPDSLQVHFCSPKLFPVVMFVAFPFGDPAVVSGQLKHILHQRASTHLIHWDLVTKQTKNKQKNIHLNTT